jgi:hypothetical protein
MRIPGFYHHKQDPFLSRIVEINDAPPIHPTDFAKAFDIDLSSPKNETKAARNQLSEDQTVYDLTSIRLGIEAAEFCTKNMSAGRRKQALRLGYEFLPEGVTILAGDPKAGKSYLTMNMNLAVATGDNAFGNCPCHGRYPCSPASVL